MKNCNIALWTFHFKSDSVHGTFMENAANKGSALLLRVDYIGMNLLYVYETGKPIFEAALIGVLPKKI